VRDLSCDEIGFAPISSGQALAQFHGGLLVEAIVHLASID
jgi:hypothetical protein